MVFDPSVLTLEALLDEYFTRARGSGATFGQYRAQLFPASEAQATVLQDLAASEGIPATAPGSAEARFWPAEDYHQKYKLRRNQELVERMASTLGSRWDEHLFATKLNAVGQRGFDLKPWLAEMPDTIRQAFRNSMLAVAV